MELHFLILLLNYDGRGYDFFLYFDLLFKNSLSENFKKEKRKGDNINAKRSPTSLQNTSGQRLKTQVNRVSCVTIILYSDTGLTDIQTGQLYVKFT